MKKSVLIILPTYNEAENIGLMLNELAELSRVSKKYDFNVLVVDDYSPDGTAKIVKNCQKINKNLHLISGKKLGLGDAYIRGMKFGLQNNNYFAFITMDADFSHDPHAIPTLLDKLAEQNDVVIGSRYVKGGFIPGNWPLVRIINSRLANFIVRLFGEFDNSVTDITSGFRAIRTASLIQVKLDDIDATGHFFLVNLLYEFIKLGAEVSEVPICFTDRERGSSKISLAVILEFLHKIYFLNPNSRIRRMCTFALVGLSGTLLNLLILSILLKLLHFNPILTDALAIEASIISNFYLNNKYTFKNSIKDTRKKAQLIDVSKFNIGALAGALISLTLFTFLFKSVHLNYIVADLLAIVISVSWNFWISTKYVWKVSNATI